MSFTRGPMGSRVHVYFSPHFEGEEVSHGHVGAGGEECQRVDDIVFVVANLPHRYPLYLILLAARITIFLLAV